MKDVLPLEDCLAAAEECNAPMVSICGGEPLIYPQIEALVRGLHEQGRIIYICTNAMFMRKKMREWMASEFPKRAGVHQGKGQCLARGGIDDRERGGRDPGRSERSGETDNWSEQMDVLERSSRWP